MTSTLLHTQKKSLLFVGRTFAMMALLLVESAWAQSTEKVIFNLGTPRSDGGLILDSQGDLFGTATGYPAETGTVFEAKRFANGTWSHYVLYRFLGGNDGKNPNAGLIFDGAGNLYGTTQAGGANYCSLSNINSTCGTIFELSPTPKGEWIEKQLYNFAGMTGNNTDGEDPNSGLVTDSAGNLYGTTAFGGAYHGTVFQLTPGSNGTWTETILYRFSDGEDGTGPTGLIRDSLGNLYGFTPVGGAAQSGTIFELSPNTDGSWTYHLLYTFCSKTNCSDGSAPTGITLDSQGNLYGAANNGGTVPCPVTSDGCGIIFKLVRGTHEPWGFRLLHTFCKKNQCSDGAFPSGAPTLQPDGTLYGLTVVGGTANRGSLFKLVQRSSAWVLTSLYSFCTLSACPDGLDPAGTLAIDGSGNLYGTTPLGGKLDAGVVFQVIP
ncbi:MAG: choice-of-anchor tandem repeat GloVer-containing protein [Candidatus Sulfotelmatobacter sp.]